MEDKDNAELLKSVKAMTGARSAGYTDDQLSVWIKTAQSYVATFKPPEEQAAYMVTLWTAHLIYADMATMNSIKVNGVQITNSGSSTDPWLKMWNDLLKRLGLNEAKVTGFA